MLLIRQRFAYIKRTMEAEHLRAKLDQVLAGQATPELLAQMDRAYEAAPGGDRPDPAQAVVQANEPTILEEESFRALMDLSTRAPSRTSTAIRSLS